MDRRNFIKKSGIALGGVSFLGAALNSCESINHLRNIGIITNTISEPMKKDWEKTLRLMADYGYKYLEHGGKFGDDLEYFKSLLKEIGIKSLAGGTNIEGLTGDKLKEQIDTCLELEKEYLICYWPWRKDFNEIKREDLKFIVEDLNQIGNTCNEQGLKFAFHNHDKEFVDLDGEIIYDFFLNNTEASLVDMEADIYWMKKGGADPIEYFNKFPGRFPILHMKDMNNEVEKDFACVGSGIINFQRVIDNSKIAGAKYLIVEHDHPQEHLKCAKTSIDHLLSLKY